MTLRTPRSFTTGLTAAALAFLVIAAAAGCATPASGAPGNTRVSRSTDIDGDRVRVKISRGLSSLELKMRGEVTLSDDDAEIVSISPGGYFILTERKKLTVRKVRIEADRSGRLSYTGNAADTDEAGRAWVASILPGLVEESGLWAEQRARRLLKSDGIDGVLEAITRIDSDSTKDVYFGVLVDEAKLQPGDFERLQRAVASSIDSDYHTAAILGRMLKHGVGRDVVGDALFRAVDSIDSAYHRADLLKPLADRVSVGNLPAFLAAVDGIDSDYHRQEVLSRLLDRQDLDGASMAEVLRQVRHVASDYHAADLLRRMTRNMPSQPAARTAYFEAVRGIGSDYHRQEVLGSVVEHSRDREVLAFVIDAATQIGSDYHKAEVLSSIARDSALADHEDTILLDLIGAAATLNSDQHLGEVLTSILRRDALSDAVLRSLLDAVKQNVGSSHQRGILLDRITDRMTI